MLHCDLNLAAAVLLFKNFLSSWSKRQNQESRSGALIQISEEVGRKVVL